MVCFRYYLDSIRAQHGCRRYFPHRKLACRGDVFVSVHEYHDHGCLKKVEGCESKEDFPTVQNSHTVRSSALRIEGLIAGVKETVDSDGG